MSWGDRLVIVSRTIQNNSQTVCKRAFLRQLRCFLVFTSTQMMTLKVYSSIRYAMIRYICIYVRLKADC